MGLLDKATAVGVMQKYITAHLDEEITLDALAKVAGYSKYHAVRVFKELTGKSLFDTATRIQLPCRQLQHLSRARPMYQSLKSQKDWVSQSTTILYAEGKVGYLSKKLFEKFHENDITLECVW